MGLVSRAVICCPSGCGLQAICSSPNWGHRVIGRWHFCVGRAEGRSVRTVERNGRTLAHGQHHFDFDAH